VGHVNGAGWCSGTGAAGVPELVLQRLGGRADPRMVSTYAHLAGSGLHLFADLIRLPGGTLPLSPPAINWLQSDRDEALANSEDKEGLGVRRIRFAGSSSTYFTATMARIGLHPPLYPRKPPQFMDTESQLTTTDSTLKSARVLLPRQLVPSSLWPNRALAALFISPV
jgi:hypothetical protein